MLQSDQHIAPRPCVNPAPPQDPHLVASFSRSAGRAGRERTASPPHEQQDGGPDGGRRGISPLAILFLTVFIDLVGFGIVIPLLPLYAERFGATPVQVTLLVAVFSLMQFFFASWWGRLSDRIGRRPVLLIGLFGSAFSYLLFGLAGSLAMLFAARILAGFMGANIGVAQAYIADVSSPSDRARGMGLIGAAFGLGFIFGPALAGLLVRFGPAVPFLAAGLLALANGLVALARLPESLPEAVRQETTRRAGRLPGLGLGDWWHTVRRPNLAPMYSITFLVTLALAGFEATFALWGDRRWNLSPAVIAYLFVYIGVLGAVVQGALVGRLAPRWGEKRLVQVGIVALVVGMAGIPLAPSLMVLAAALAAFSVGRGFTTPPLFSLVSRVAAADDQGRVLGASQSLSALGRVVGPVLAGIAFSRMGIAAPYLLGAGLAGVTLLLLPAIPRGGAE